MDFFHRHERYHECFLCRTDFFSNFYLKETKQFLEIKNYIKGCAFESIVYARDLY
jgi:hypothetical protein